MPGAVAIHSHSEHWEYWDYWEPSLTSVSASTWELGASPASSQQQQLSSPRYTKVSQSIVIIINYPWRNKLNIKTIILLYDISDCLSVL